MLSILTGMTAAMLAAGVVAFSAAAAVPTQATDKLQPEIA